MSTLHTIAAHNVHSSWVTSPEFQVLTNVQTLERWGRFYIPASYLAESGDRFIQWMSQEHIDIDPRDLKKYDDGSIRLSFGSTEAEYARCTKYFGKQELWAAGKQVA